MVEKVESCKGKCSICGSEDVTYGDTKNVGESLGYEIYCKSCEAHGYEWYTLTYSDTIMVKEWD